MIRAVFFDVDDTLVDFDSAARTAFGTIFGEQADYSAWTALSRQWYPRHPKELSWADMRVGRTAAFLESLGRHDDPDATEARRMQIIEDSYQLFTDVLACLSQLRRLGLRLGVITNSEAAHQRRKLGRVGLRDAFDVVVISGEVGVSKPEPAIFEHACAAIDVAAGEALHVGDRLDLDALGARDAGLSGVWLDRPGVAAGESQVPVVRSLAELPALIN